MKAFYDDDYLYISAIWNDTDIDIHDMWAICWDMNCSEYSSAMLATEDAMETSNPGEYVDTWHWINNLRDNITVNGYLKDDCFNYEGWIYFDETEDHPDPRYGYIYGDLKGDGKNYYQLEIRRKLKSRDKNYDVNFEVGESYRFATAVWDRFENQAHAISWTWQMNIVPGNRIASYKFGALISISLIGVILIITKNKLKINKQDNLLIK